MSSVRRHRALLAVLGAGLALRLLLAYVIAPGQGYATDLGLFWSWAQALAADGPGTFYAANGSANYPPAYLSVLGVIGLTGNDGLLKLPAILADVGIAAVAYALAASWRGHRAGLVAAALFLFLPVAWYDSALWGQVDAIGTLVAMLALLALVRGWSEGAVAFAVLAVLVKPQYAITFGVVLPVLVRRHLVAVGSGPVPVLGPRLAALDARLDGLVRDQGPRRLATSFLAGLLVLVIGTLPFDLATYASPAVADVPVIGNIAGLLGLYARAAGDFNALTANAFNPWALIGAPTLAQTIGSGNPTWTSDALPIVGDVPAVAIGAGALIVVGLLVAGGLLVRDGVLPILLGFSILALAFFVLPTRVHERYLFPFFGAAAVLAAPAAMGIAGYVALNLLATVNLHAVLSGNVFVGGFGGGPRVWNGGGGFGDGRFGGAGSGWTPIELPLGDLARSEAAVTLVALGSWVALLVLLAAWALVVFRPRWAPEALVTAPG
jgi:hypothetical protein